MAEYIGYTFNKGIQSFGEAKVKQILESFNKRYNLPIVSIGSGSGSIEHYTNNLQSNNIKWILIDPAPVSFHGNLVMEPNYSYVDDLINTNPNIIGNCLLFLNWCDPNDSEYDYEAIIKLQPIAICSVYEEYESYNGAAGGEKFFNWTLSNNDYQIIEQHYLTPHEDDMNNMDIMIKIWQSEKKPFENEEVVVSYTKSLIRHEKETCCIS
jgi:hypothetical protein